MIQKRKKCMQLHDEHKLENRQTQSDSISAAVLDGEPAWGTYRPKFLTRLLIESSRRTFLNHGPFRRTLNRIVRRLHANLFDYEVWGHKLRLYPHENISDRKALYYPHRFDPKEFSHLLASVRPDGTVMFVDIGANAGFYSLFLLSRVSNSKILAFEPHPIIYRRLQYNLRNYSGNRLKIFPLALGDAEGLAILELAGGSSHIVENGRGAEVRVRKLIDVLNEERISYIDMLKIDVEGYEDKVLRSFFAEAPKTLLPKHMIIEHLSRKAWKYDCIDAAQRLGYKIVSTSRNNTIMSLVA